MIPILAIGVPLYLLSGVVALTIGGLAIAASLAIGLVVVTSITVAIIGLVAGTMAFFVVTISTIAVKKIFQEKK